MLLGVDYYPEQWDESMLDDDLDGIAAMGANVIRIGEFAWDRMEPEDGRYDFSFFDEVIRRAKQRGLAIVMGVPTATPPAWLYRQNPSIASLDAHLNARGFGGRRGYCYNSAVYRQKSADIAYALSRHYRTERAIILWQVDNEIGHEGSDTCCCGDCRGAFHAFLERRYGSIDQLNEAWGTAFWSQTYRSFSEVPLPAANTLTAHNPGLRLAYDRFMSDSIAGFLDVLTQSVKRGCPSARVMHDFSGGTFQKRFDFFSAARSVDEAAYNNYPVWGGQREPLPAGRIAFNLDAARGINRGNFLITEQIMGAQGHDVIGFLPRPNQARLWAMQALAHGCNGMLFFRWRGATKGAEQFCFGILDADNQKGRRYDEVRAFFADAKQFESVWSSPIQTQICILTDYDSQRSFANQRQSEAFCYEDELFGLYKPLFRRGLMADFVSQSEDFSGYRVVIVPYMIVMEERMAQRLMRFAEEGGILILTFCSAWKGTENELIFGERLPARLTGAVGARVCEHESLYLGQTARVVSQDGAEGNCLVMREMLEPVGAKTLLSYDDPFYADYAAATKNAYGKGMVYYFGAAFDEALTDRLMADALGCAGIDVLPADSPVEVVTRQGGDGTYRILLNHSALGACREGKALEAFAYCIERV